MNIILLLCWFGILLFYGKVAFCESLTKGWSFVLIWFLNYMSDNWFMIAVWGCEKYGDEFTLPAHLKVYVLVAGSLGVTPFQKNL